jgi:hypothetical protein
VWINCEPDNGFDVGVENDGSLVSRRTGNCAYGSVGSSYRNCVLAGVDACVVWVDAEVGSGGGASGGNGGCPVVGVDIPSAVGLERLAGVDVVAVWVDAEVDSGGGH